jgi:hypothetical protein
MKNLFLEKLLEEVYFCEGSTWKTRDLRNLNEDSQKEVADKTVTKLFKDIKAKAFNLDFSEVEIGKGDITKIKNYSELKNAINYLRKISTNVKNPELIDAVTQINLAHDNLLANKSGFVNGFKSGNNLLIYLFNSVSIALIQATAFVATNSVEFVKDNLNTFQPEMAATKKLPKNANLSALKRFNEMARNGKLHNVISHTLKLKESVSLTFLTTTIGAILLALIIIREIIFTFYFVRISMSQYLDYLKNFVLMNASNLSNDQRKIKEKQEKVAKILGKLSDKLAVDQNLATERSKQSIIDNNKETSYENNPQNSGELSDILY